MKRAEISVFCLSMFAILTNITSSSANSYDTFVYDEPLEMISETEDVVHFNLQTLYNTVAQTYATSSMFGCYKWKRVWRWSGWRFKRVWRRVRVNCQQAAPVAPPPGGTIPPH